MVRQTMAEKRATTRAALVEAAIEVFSARGYLASSLDQVSDAAGYSTGAVYSNFDGKEGLFLACLAARSSAQMSIWEESIASVESAGTGRAALAQALTKILPDPKWTRASFEFRLAATSDAGRDALVAYQLMWRDVVTRLLVAYCRGLRVTPAASPAVLAGYLTAMVDGLRLYALVDAEVDIPGSFAAAIDDLLEGSRAGRRAR